MKLINIEIHFVNGEESFYLIMTGSLEKNI